MTDNEINEAVARKLGWTYFPAGGFSGWGYKTLEPTQATPPDYCHDIKAAWEIVEKIKNLYLVTLWWHDGEWECDIEMEKGAFKTNDDTAPTAICLAFLKLESE